MSDELKAAILVRDTAKDFLLAAYSTNEGIGRAEKMYNLACELLAYLEECED